MKNISLTTFITVLTIFVSLTSCEADNDLQELEQNSQKSGLATTRPINPTAKTTNLDTFWMREDHEPWNRGKAEIYAFVIGLDQEKDPIIQEVSMDYADHDKTMYYPEELLINWSNFYFDTVSIVFIEADDAHFTAHNPNWEYPIADGELNELSVEFALKYLVENFRNLSQIDDADDWVDHFENISRFQNYDVVGGKLDNVYITLERQF